MKLAEQRCSTVFIIYSNIQERLWRSCRGVIECEAFFHWPRLRSAGGFILEEDWTPTKTKLLQLATYRGGSLIFFQDESCL